MRGGRVVQGGERDPTRPLLSTLLSPPPQVPTSCSQGPLSVPEEQIQIIRLPQLGQTPSKFRISLEPSGPSSLFRPCLCPQGGLGYFRDRPPGHSWCLPRLPPNSMACTQCPLGNWALARWARPREMTGLQGLCPLSSPQFGLPFSLLEWWHPEGRAGIPPSRPPVAAGVGRS